MHENEDSFNAYQENKEDLDNAYSIYTEKGKPKKMGWSIASMILGILSLILTSFGWVALILGVLAIIFSVIARAKLGYFNGFAIAGLITGIFGTVFGIAAIVIEIFAPQILERLAELLGDMSDELPDELPDTNSGI